jgi:hypothetical protein
VIRYTSTNLPAVGWEEYRKLGTTRMAPVIGPCIVETKEGEYELPDGWQGYVALDKDGDPYPIASEMQASAYERVEN